MLFELNHRLMGLYPKGCKRGIDEIAYADSRHRQEYVHPTNGEKRVVAGPSLTVRIAPCSYPRVNIGHTAGISSLEERRNIKRGTAQIKADVSFL